MITRKKFLQSSALGLASLGIPFVSKNKGLEDIIINNSADKSNSNNLPPLGIAGWTFRYIDNHGAIEMMKRINVRETTLKSFQLPLDSSKETIDNVLSLFDKAGITVYGVGVIYMNSKADVDQAFEYAKNVNVPVIVGVPTHELIPYAEKKVKEYDIKLAIHNHGPEDELYPGPDVVYDKVKNLDPRMGLCFDIGHGKRDGISAAEGFVEYHDRIFDMHIKDVTKGVKDGKAIEVGRGVIDFPKLVSAIAEKGYSGHYSLEYEVNMQDPLPGLAESLGYFNGTCNATLEENA